MFSLSRSHQDGFSGAASLNPRDFVFLGQERLDHFEKNCTDLPLSEVEIDALKNVTSCRVARSLGYCENEWVAKGYCRRTCGDCRPRSDLDVGFAIRSMNGDRMQIYPRSNSSSSSESNRGPPFDLVVNGSMRITDYAEACNGALYVLDDIEK